MAETLNKRIRATLAREARENAQRYWATKAKEAEGEKPMTDWPKFYMYLDEHGKPTLSDQKPVTSKGVWTIEPFDARVPENCWYEETLVELEIDEDAD